MRANEWSFHDDCILEGMYKDAVPIAKIALILDRTEGACRARVRVLELGRPDVSDLFDKQLRQIAVLVRQGIMYSVAKAEVLGYGT